MPPNYQQLLFDLKRIRYVEEYIAKEYSKGQMRCPTHLSIGQEAVAVGVCSALTTHDLAVSGHRAHAHYLAKGGDLKAMIAEIYGKKTGCCQGKGGSMHLVDINVGFMGSTAIVGGTIPVGVGLGLSIHTKGEDRICVVFFGEGATEEGVFYESVNFAVIKNLPVLFICENNLYSVYSPLSVRQPPDRQITKMVTTMGIHSDRGDGNNILEVQQKTQQAIKQIKQEGKPFLLEFDTYRHREHCGPHFDNDIGYRSVAEFEQWLQKEPVLAFTNALIHSAIINQEDITTMDQTITQEVEEAFDLAQKDPFPDSQETYNHLFKGASL